MTSKILAVAFLSGFMKAAHLHQYPVPPKILNTEWKQETGGSHNWGITGDSGLALGPLQIHEPTYEDATNYNSTLANHPYSYVTNLPYADQVYTAYQNKYSRPAMRELANNPNNLNAVKQLFATWHGGPGRYSTPGTLSYVRQALHKYLHTR